MTISERLYNLRKEKNISQEELANELGVSRQTISKWETGESTPDFDKIIPLCNYYGITSDELISGKKDIVESKKEEVNSHFARNIAVSISLYIFSLVAIIVSTVIFAEPIIGVSIFFSIIALATGLIVYSAIKYKEREKEKKKEEDEKKNKVSKQVCDIVSLIGLIVYFLVSFTTGAWQITWIIFIVIALCNSIVRLLFGIKEDKCEECSKEESDNE